MVVYRVTPGSSAEEAGLRGATREVIAGNYRIPIGGDLIYAIDGKRTDRIYSIRRLLAGKHPGDKVTLTIYRNGHKLDVHVTLSAAPDNS